MNVIDIVSLTKDYGNSRGIFNLTYSVKKGEVFGFLGPNGSGKTTTIRQLLGFIHPDKGECFINGLNCSFKASLIQKDLGYLPGEIAFFDDMKGTDFIEFIAKMKGIADLSKADELTKIFDLDANIQIKKMSKGTKQKIGIVCAFMGDNDVYILDEPTSGLDPLMQNIFIDMILKEKKKGKTILMSSHIFEEVEKTCDRVAIIKQGRLVAIDSVENIKNSKKKTFTVTFSNEAQLEEFAKEYNVKSQNMKVKIEIIGSIDKFIKDLSKFSIENLEEEKGTLEEVFMHYYGGEQND
ncbi:MAG: ABC transporter ATP-binding protein [Clostridia bacterium]|nr:ABC transporter ATP-binding protein [Clostridia bacterium]